MKKKIAVLFCLLLSLTIVQAQVDKGMYSCDNESFSLLKKLSDSRLKNGEVMVFTTTHQDLGWLNYVEACTIDRDTLWLTPFLERLRVDPDFKMDIEQTSILMEYLHRHPAKRDSINKYLKEGRICVGGTYIQPYEEMYSGESLARQFYLGTRWLKKTFDGYNSVSYFNVDVPGRTLQMPQIMKKAGIDNLIISRHERGLFNWEAPDGSKVRTYTPGHYIYFYNVLGLSDTAAIKEMAKESELWYTKYNDMKQAQAVMPAMLNYEFIWDQKNVNNCLPFMNKWNEIQYIQNESGKKQKVNLPKFRYAIADEFFKKLDSSTSTLPVIKGERPNVWLYIHGPSHERALTTSRQGDVMLPAAEKISSFIYLAEGNFTNYPTDQLAEAWKAKIYPDHGWGGNGGILTDDLFRRNYEAALHTATSIVEKQANLLASMVQTDAGKGRPVVLFNTLTYQRNAPVSLEVSLEEGFAKGVVLTDAQGKTIPCQLANPTYHIDHTISKACISFVAEEIPAMGMKTYYLKAAAQPRATAQGQSGVIENSFYRIELKNNGIRQIFDKALEVNLLDTEKFLCGDVITMRSIGNGAGEFDAVQQPDMEGFDKTSIYPSSWILKEEGEVYTTLVARSPIRHAVIEQTLRIYHKTKRIDMDVALLNWENVMFREYRWMLPLAMKQGTVSYEVPFGALTVGQDEMPGCAGERYMVENKLLHPRGIGNWISASGNGFAVTLSSSVAVADYVDPTTFPTENTILQPILLASRKSCHYLGNDYFQPGDHYYHFSFTSHAPASSQREEFGVSVNEPVLAVFNPRRYQNAFLPETGAFVSTDNDRVVISAIKKCEDDNSLIIRLYNKGDKEETVHLTFMKSPKQWIHTNLIEEEIAPVDKIVVGKYGIETYKVKF